MGADDGLLGWGGGHFFAPGGGGRGLGAGEYFIILVGVLWSLLGGGSRGDALSSAIKGVVFNGAADAAGSGGQPPGPVMLGKPLFGYWLSRRRGFNG